MWLSFDLAPKMITQMSASTAENILANVDGMLVTNETIGTV
jgi:hypothetical protein